MSTRKQSKVEIFQRRSILSNELSYYFLFGQLIEIAIFKTATRTSQTLGLLYFWVKKYDQCKLALTLVFRILLIFTIHVRFLHILKVSQL